MSELTSVLPDRAVLRVGGADRGKFLDGLVSCATADLAPGGLAYGALLTPQGKIITDMMIFAEDDALALDVPQAARADLMRRLSLYRLRAAVTLEEADARVAVTFEEDGTPADPARQGSLGGRRLVAPAGGAEDADVLARYTAARIAAGVPDAQIDFALGRRLPARRQHGPHPRRRLQEGLLRWPGGGVADAPSGHGAAPHGDRGRQRRSAAHRGRDLPRRP
ncbi:MAG: hypothetical protein AcusKO_34760 [Acuticoccus sp.]